LLPQCLEGGIVGLHHRHPVLLGFGSAPDLEIPSRDEWDRG
jgi:hypothetical protein